MIQRPQSSSASCVTVPRSLAKFAAMRRASIVEEVNSDTSHMAGNSHTDNNSGCNIDTETPTAQYEHNLNSCKNKSPASSGLGGGEPSAFLRRRSPDESERLYAAGVHLLAT
jgi:hypothetical protein